MGWGFGSRPAIADSASRNSSPTGSSACSKASSAISRFRIGAFAAVPPSSTEPTLRNMPAVAASQPTVSNVGDMSITPSVSMRPCVVRMP